MSRRLALLLALSLGSASASAISCGPTLGSGAAGTFRFIARVKGTPPLAIIPPVSDRQGNVYTAYGALDLRETEVFVSAAAGGSVQSCASTKGDAYGQHGFVGFGDDRVWYWSGDALVVVLAAGGCRAILNTDPHTNSDLQFKAVLPFVRVTSTRSSLVALVKSPTDLAPFSALIDLERGIMSNVTALSGTIDVVGVGAERDGDARVALLSRDGKMEADFFDEDAYFTGSAPVSGTVPPEYGVVGALRRNAAGTWAGLTSSGALLVFNRSGGGEMAFDASVKPVGVHLWKEALWLVGTNGTRPVVVPLDDSGRPGQVFAWDASAATAATVSGALLVNDDRSYPVRQVTWTNVVSAVGAKPFLGPFSPWPNTPDSSLVVIAGPTSTEGSRSVTSIAIASVGLTYP